MHIFRIAVTGGDCWPSVVPWLMRARPSGARARRDASRPATVEAHCEGVPVYALATRTRTG
jgi:hypothetical protein